MSDDCDLLTSQVIDAWFNLPNNITVNYSGMSDCISQRNAQRAAYMMASKKPTLATQSELQELTNCCALPSATLEADLANCEQRRTAELDNSLAKIWWQHLNNKLPVIAYKWLTPIATIPCLRVEQEAIDLIAVAAEQATALLMEPLLHTASSKPFTQDVVLAPTSSHQGGQLLNYILSHDDLAPVLLNWLHSWPSLMSHGALKCCRNLHSICSDVARQHNNWMSEIRSGRLLFWLHCDPPSAREELAPLIIDDCRNSMVTLTVQAARRLAARYAGICKLSAEAVEASIEASSPRRRAILMCRAGDSMPTVKLNRLLGIRTMALLHTWAAATARYRAHILGRVIDIRASVADYVKTEIKPLLARWLQQTYCPAESKLGRVLGRRALWLTIAAKSKMKAMVQQFGGDRRRLLQLFRLKWLSTLP